MISLTLAAMLAAAPPAGGPPAQPRKAYGACLTKVAKAKAGDKLAGDAVKAALASGCATEEAAFKKSLVDYDVRSGMKRADAEEGAQLQVNDYLVNAAELYEMNTAGAEPK